MNPRDFCAKQGHPWALFLTYAFDPVFFERLVLRDLSWGGSHAVLVVADPGEIERSMVQAMAAGLRALGRSYALAPAAAPAGAPALEDRSDTPAGAFHPKIFLRLGPDSGLAWIGTGNLTHGGWGLNRELATAWQVGPQSEDEGEWIAPLLRRVLGWAPSPLAASVVEAMLRVDWVAASTEEDMGRLPLLLTDRQSLAAQLERRWRGRRFHTLHALTGSTDGRGRMLRWAQRVFGVERVRIALDPSRASFDLEGLAGLPLDLEFVEQRSPPLHAKLFWFDGPDGAAAVVGSPNCSAAAWLHAWSEGGNLEASLVHDHAAGEAFAEALAPLQKSTVSAAAVLPVRRELETPERVPIPYRLADLHWEQDLARVEIAFDGPGPPADASLVLELPDEANRLVLEDGCWWAPQPETAGGGRSLIARVRVRLADGTEHVTPPRWIDIPHLLRETLDRRTYADAVLALARPPVRSDKAMLDELAQIAGELLTDGAGHLDPLGLLRKERKKRPGEGRLIDPSQLLRSLEDLSSRPRQLLDAGNGVTLGIGGIFRAIFGDVVNEDDSEDVAETAEDDEFKPGSEPGSKLGSGANASLPDSDGQKELKAARDRDRRRFAGMLDRFVAELGEEAFGQRCTATQLRQAVAFPVAASIHGRMRGFATDEVALAAIKGVADVLLYGRDGGAPLLKAARARYRGEERETAFERIEILWSRTLRWGLALDAELPSPKHGGKVRLYCVQRGTPATFLVGSYWVSVDQAARLDRVIAEAHSELVELTGTVMQASQAWVRPADAADARHM